MENALYSFVIVDDEPEIREGIRDNIPWEELGFHFAGAFPNGTEALELLEHETPDVVMTDINMPFMDGFTLCERIQEVSPETTVLIISGYDDFDYARRALKLQVHDFILKPVTPMEFKSALRTLKTRLDGERAARLDMERIKRQLAESLPLLKERFLNRLIAGDVPQEDVAERLDYFGFALPSAGRSYIVMLLDFIRRRGGEEFDLDIIAEKNLVEAELAEALDALVFQDSGDRMVVLGWADRPDSLYREGLKAAETMRSALARIGMESIAVGIGEVVEDLSLLPRSHQDAQRALSFALLRGKTGVTAYRELVGRIGHDRDNAPDWGKAIAAALKTAAQEEALVQIDQMIDSFRKKTFDVDGYYATLRVALASIVRTIEELEVAPQDIFAGTEDPFAEVRELKSLDDARDWFVSIVDRIVHALDARQESFARMKVREAIEYIQIHYAEPDLSIGALCKELYISTSYFSSILKKYDGKTFVERLTEERMHKAKELLRTSSLKTYEVAERAGYRDAHYFSLCFRKFVGETPTEYRNGRDHER